MGGVPDVGYMHTLLHPSHSVSTFHRLINNKRPKSAFIQNVQPSRMHFAALGVRFIPRQLQS